MPLSIARSHQNFPAHTTIIGDLLLGYSDLEFFMVDLVAQSFGREGIDTAVRVLYCLRGANDRLNVANALLRPFMDKLSLSGPYGQWLGAMRRCRIIRNQYAHCGWSERKGRLWFVNLEDAAEPADGATSLEYFPIDFALLKEQQDYFEYAARLTFYLMDEARFRRDRRRRHKTRLPKSRAAPNLHSPLS